LHGRVVRVGGFADIFGLDDLDEAVIGHAVIDQLRFLKTITKAN